MRSGTIRAASIAGAVLACMTPDGARPQDLQGSVTLYGWLPSLDAEVTSRSGGTPAFTSVDAGNVLEALNFAFMAAGEVHYGRVGIIQDFVYADLGAGGNLSGPLASKVNVDTTVLISTTAVGYRAYEQDGWLVEPFAGARYVDLELGVKIAGGGPLGVERAASVDLNWWDPIIGLRGRAPITRSLSAAGFVDIGGFGAGSDFSWEAYAGLDYAFTENVSAVAGFRYLSINYDQGRTEVKLDTYGPVVGAMLRF